MSFTTMGDDVVAPLEHLKIPKAAAVQLPIFNYARDAFDLQRAWWKPVTKLNLGL